MPDPATSLAIALPKAAVWVRDAVKADRANAYGLDAPWTLPKLGGDLAKLGLVPPDYFDEGWHIQGGVITELPVPCPWAAAPAARCRRRGTIRTRRSRSPRTATPTS